MVVGISTSGRTLDLLSKEGHLLRRNRRFVRPLAEDKEAQQ